MKIKRTLFSCLMALALVCVCLLVLPTEAQAASVDDLTFSFNELHQEYAVSLCDSDASGNLVIPATYNGYPVTSIEGSAFSHCAGLTSVTIPDSITYISSFAFYDCPGLISVHIGDGIHTLTMAVFDGCSNLSSVTIGSGVKVIGQYAFHNCPNLTEVYYNGTEEQWNAISVLDRNDILSEATICFLADFTYSVANGKATITGYTGNGGNVLIPSELGGYPVTAIDTQAFSFCYITSVTIPDSVTSIGDFAFYDCDSLTSVTIGNGVTSMGDSAFHDCDSLTSVTIGNGVTSIGSNAFSNCDSLTSVIIPDSVTVIESEAFYDCDRLTSVTIPDSITNIGSNAFSNCSSLTGIIVDSENEYYSSDETGVLFNKKKTALIQYPAENTATQYTIPNSVTVIESEAFYDCDRLTSVTIPDSVTIISDYAFYDCDSFTSMTIPNSVTVISGYVFYGCDSLTSVTIGNRVALIGHHAFYNCDSLTNVYYTGTKTRWNAITIAEYNEPLRNATFHFKQEISAPTSFKATLTGYNDVKLTWKAGKSANRYYVYYRRAGKTDWKRAATTTGLTYTIKDLVENGKYEFKVISYLKDSSGTYKGASTKVLTCSTTRNLKAPSKVTLKLYGYDDVKISWSKVTYAKGYKVYYKRSTAKSYSYVGFTTGTSIKKANLSDGVKYTFKVVPCTKVNGSYFEDDSSKTASITTLKAVSTPKVTKYTSSKVKVSWTDISGESGYQVIVTSDKAGKKVVSTTTTTGKSKVVTAKKGVTYYYKVRAYKTVDGKKIYAPWSKVKAYKLK